jgi:hypothetical protein
MKYFIIALFSVFLFSCGKPGCSHTSKQAKQTATAEYRCFNTKWLSESGHVHKLNVCGRVRWYECIVRCEGCYITCKEIQPKKSSP